MTNTLIGEASDTSTATPAATDETTEAAANEVASTQQNSTESETTETQETPKAVERAAPEKYDFTAPEGSALDSGILTEFEGIARELKMPQEEAQTIVAKLAPKISERIAAQQQEAVATASAQWADASKSDKEFGGDKLPESLAAGEKFLQTFATPELRTLLKDSRLGNHPEVIRMIVRAGKALSEDGFVTGKSKAETSRDNSEMARASRMYPTSK